MRASRASADHGAGRNAEWQVRTRPPVELAPQDALALLASATFGRVVFTYRALPTVCLVDHVVDDGLIVIRSRSTSRIAAAIADQLPYPTVVAYEADEVDATSRLGWQVIATGVVRAVTDPEQVARLKRLPRSWADPTMNSFLTLQPEIITGLLLSLSV
ncbi:pyridoxamine 5'-phosphate oxidase family protein [Thermopolyspora sp. NPDC052614]|uniref:pyridoxamine 5'-phosphate oxidase family protein n=1 Tax=Thermopolyspora sp. NPDC052614 TaxID=3155682 RepID=UPI00342BBF1A